MLTILLQVRTGRTAAGSHDDTTSPFHLRTLVLIEGNGQRERRILCDGCSRLVVPASTAFVA